MEITVNGTESFWFTRDGIFEFTLPEHASPYPVTISTQPVDQKCAMFHGNPSMTDQATLSVVCSVDNIGVFITPDEIFYALVDESAGVINIRKGLPGMALYEFNAWVDVGPFSGTIHSIVLQNDWLYITDDHTLYRASNLNNQGTWSMARMVWNVDSKESVILGISANEAGLTVAYSGNTGDEYIVLDSGEYDFASCAEPAPIDYDYEMNQFYFGTNGWIEYRPGTLPIILAAPHGGYLEPAEIPVFSDGLDGTTIIIFRF
jgi:hypothetical protein